MFSIRKIRKLINRLRGVPLVLALYGCAGEIGTDAPSCHVDPVATSACTTKDFGTPRPDYGLTCEPGAYPEGPAYFAAGTSPAGTWCHVPEELTCQRVGIGGCSSDGCWETLTCNRDPSGEFGGECEIDGNAYFCFYPW